MTARTSASLGSPIHASGVFSLATPASTAPRAPIATGLTPRARLRHTRAPAGRGGRHMATATVDSIELYYEEHGRGDPLLLIMGLAADSTAWMFQVPDFARRYRTIAFDNRGVGRSSRPPGPYTIHQMADDAAGLLDALDLQRAHVLGVSMGGMIAQELALRHPERVHLIQSPTLVITRDADLLVSPANSDILARSIPGAKLMKIPGGSHGFNLETPENFNRAVHDFLAGVP